MRKSSGFSLVEAMLTASVISITALLFSNFGVTTFKISRGAAATADLTNKAFEISSYFKVVDPRMCPASFTAVESGFLSINPGASTLFFVPLQGNAEIPGIYFNGAWILKPAQESNPISARMKVKTQYSNVTAGETEVVGVDITLTQKMTGSFLGSNERSQTVFTLFTGKRATVNGVNGYNIETCGGRVDGIYDPGSPTEASCESVGGKWYQPQSPANAPGICWGYPGSPPLSFGMFDTKGPGGEPISKSIGNVVVPEGNDEGPNKVALYSMSIIPLSKLSSVVFRLYRSNAVSGNFIIRRIDTWLNSLPPYLVSYMPTDDGMEEHEGAGCNEANHWYIGNIAKAGSGRDSDLNVTKQAFYTNDFKQESSARITFTCDYRIYPNLAPGAVQDEPGTPVGASPR